MSAIRRQAKKVKDGLEPVADAVENASDSRALDVIARFGYAMTGLVHILIGVVAVRLTLGLSGEADTSGAIERLAEGGPGSAIMWVGFVGCIGLALWQLSEATLRARHLQRRERLGKMFMSGSLSIAYAVLGGTFANFAVGPGSDSSRATAHFSATVLRSPIGTPLLIAVGLIVLAVGGYFIDKGARRKFRPELRHFEGSRINIGIHALGVVGHVSKGIALLLVGALFIVAALNHEPQESTGLDGSLKALMDQPLGGYVLAIIGFGFVCHGTFAIVRSQLGRM